jgi:hypothetical protein
MKKLLTSLLLLALLGGMAFAEDEGEGDFMHVQVGASIMYKQPLGDGFSFYNFRAGVTGDLLFSLGFIEIGPEIGIYAMSLDNYYYSYYYYDFFVFEVPLNGLVRINFSDDRSFALELRGGGWFVMAMAGAVYTAFGWNAGARLVVSSFYIGGDYIVDPIFGESWAAEAGVKFSF